MTPNEIAQIRLMNQQIAVNNFQSQDKATLELIEQTALEFGDFLNKKVHLK